MYIYIYTNIYVKTYIHTFERIYVCAYSTPSGPYKVYICTLFLIHYMNKSYFSFSTSTWCSTSTHTHTHTHTHTRARANSFSTCCFQSSLRNAATTHTHTHTHARTHTHAQYIGHAVFSRVWGMCRMGVCDRLPGPGSWCVVKCVVKQIYTFTKFLYLYTRMEVCDRLPRPWSWYVVKYVHAFINSYIYENASMR